MNGVKKALDLYVVRSPKKKARQTTEFGAPFKSKIADAKIRVYFAT